jgi:hypothetical protein
VHEGRNLRRFSRATVTALAVAVLAAASGCGTESGGPASVEYGAGETTAPETTAPEPAGTLPETQPAGEETAPGETVAETEPAAPPLSEPAYQELLAARMGNVRDAIDGISAASAYEGLIRRTQAALKATEAAADALEAATPPDEALAVHGELVAALRTLADNLGNTVEAIESRSLCAPRSVAARLGQLKAGDALRAIRRELAAQGHAIPAVLPAAKAVPDRRLDTGTELLREIESGPGLLTVENGLSVDGVIALVPAKAKKAVLSFFVRSRDSHTIEGIGDGRYRVYFTAGRDWDEDLGRFTRKCDFEVFDDVLEYETTNQDGSYLYQTWTLTLNPVVGGTASTSDVAPGDFPSVG